MLLLLAIVILFVNIWLSVLAWKPFEKVLEGNRYGIGWRILIFLVSFSILTFFALYILDNSIYLER
jgi:hypothetical protein